jgi:hypothetical protein
MWSSPWAAAMPVPSTPGKRYEDWQLKDPAGQPVEVVRGIRDEIDARVRQPSPNLSRHPAKNS